MAIKGLLNKKTNLLQVPDKQITFCSPFENHQQLLLYVKVVNK